MVVLHVKGEAEEKQFLYECSAGSPMEDVLTAVVLIHNLQSKILHLSVRLRELFFEGSPLETWTDSTISLYRSASEAELMLRRPLLPHILRDHVQSLEKEIIVSPLMESSEVKLAQLLSDFVPLNGEMAQLWVAGKELLRGKQLCDYIGKNEKTKITVRLQSASSDAVPDLSLCK
ncbi:unnamed protein product [Spirodela intermedia]|uniref:Uncharacterized protein n=1 Tax=Spirodela intermedia TaxID=51605 RepID=A0A7I8ICU4_SPIIN|nr:unnamed protein product [Spirodela intermedia]CAA6654862.1 unnamed protein product [Spirodela intermedia]